MRAISVSLYRQVFLNFLATLLLAAWALAAGAQTDPGFHAIPTFHSLGLYWAPANKSATHIAQVEYKVQGAAESEYKRGLDLWYDTRTAISSQGAGQYRGSLVHLAPDTAYDIRLTLVERDGGAVVSPPVTIDATQTCTNPPASCTRTWSEEFPAAPNNIIDINTRLPATGYPRVTLTAADSGSPGNWKIYTAPPGANTINQAAFPNGDGVGSGPNQWTDSCIVLEDVSYVVIRGLKLENCTEHGIYLSGNSHHIVIDSNEITGWGGLDDKDRPDDDAGVYCNSRSLSIPNKVHAVVVQKNLFHNPRHGSSPWGPFKIHPEGALAMNFFHCGGNHVVRYNEVYASTGHYFKDGFGGHAEFANDEPQSGVIKGGGFPWADSDIYGNRIQNVFDDAIESEGDNRNVRIWENYIDQVFTAFATAATAKGPFYIWRNVSHSQGGMNQRPQCPDEEDDKCPAGTPPAAPDDENRGEFIKGGAQTTTYRGGRVYFFHNTILQPPASHCDGSDLPCGAGGAITNVEKYLYNFWSHNNLWVIHKPDQVNGEWKFSAVVATCSLGSAANQTECRLSHDMYNGGVVSGATRTPPNWLNVTPVYAASDGPYPGSASIPSSPNWQGDFTLKVGTTGRGEALVLFNFNNQYASPDVGAHQSGTGPMKFGRAAATGGGGNTAPVAMLNTTPSPATGSEPLPVTFDASASLDGSSPIASLRLEFGHGTPPQEANWTDKNQTQQYTYPAGAAPYTATLTVTAANGQADNAQVQVAVTNSCSAPPTASFTATPQSGTAPLPVAFDASASSAVSPATIANYSITYGDGGSGISSMQSHTYQSAGNYVATLIVTDSNNCQSAPATQPITVTEPGKPAFRSAATASYGGNILFRAAASAATNGSSLITNRPSGTVANDVMIASIAVRPATVTIGVPAGWTLVRRIDNGTNISLAVFRKVAGSGEPSSYTWDVSGATYAVGGIKSFANVDTANPIDVENGQATPTALTHTAPGVTTTVANAMVVTAHTFATSTTWTPPSGMTEAFDAQFQPVGANLGQSMEGNYVVQAAAGATGAKTATAAGSAGAEGSGATHTLALRPAPAALNIAQPAGTAANDVMIASIGVRPATVSIGVPAGWTLVRRIDNGTNISLAVFRRVAGSSEPGSYAWDVSGATYAVGGIQSFTNVDTANPIDVEDGQATPTALTHATPSVTSTVANAMVVTAHTFATSTTWTQPSGMTEAFDTQVQPVPANQGQSIEANYVLQASAGATGAKTATAAGGAGAEGTGATHILVLRPPGSAPAFRAASSAQMSGSSVSVNRPTGTAANDVMIASIGMRPATVTIGVPAGWTLVRRIDNGTNISLAVFRKVAGAGEPSSYAWDVTGATYAVGGIQAFANVDTANPIDVENGQTTPTALTHTAPSVTTTVANAMVVTAHTFATSTTWTPPSGMTEAFDAQHLPAPTNSGVALEGNHVGQAAAGATGAKTATAAGGAGAEGSGATHTFALRPM